MCLMISGQKKMIGTATDMKTYKGMARNQMIEKIATAKVAECKARNDYTMSLLKQRMREQFPLLNQLGLF